MKFFFSDGYVLYKDAKDISLDTEIIIPILRPYVENNIYYPCSNFIFVNDN